MPLTPKAKEIGDRPYFPNCLVNADLLRRVADAIELNPDSYDQGSFCGTRHCIAGFACVLSGYNIKELGVLEIPEVAMNLLGIDKNKIHLFYGDWKPKIKTTVPDELRHYADHPEDI